MKKLSALILGLLTITLLLSCNEEDPCPSCMNDIVTCKVNGKEWSANCKGDGLFGCYAVNCYYYIKDGFDFDLNGSNESDNSGIVIRKSSSHGGLKFGANSLDYKSGFQYWDHSLTGNSGNCSVFYLDSSYSSSIILLKHDTILSYVEGTFYGRAINECGDSVIITEGYFKTNYFY